MQSKQQISLEQIPCGFLATNLENQITAINSTLCEWLNIGQDDVLGKNLSQLLPISSRLLFLGNILPSLQLNLLVEENYLIFKVANAENLPLMLNAKKIEHDGHSYFSYALMKMNRRHLIEAQLIEERHKAKRITEEKEAINLELKLTQQALLEKHEKLVKLNEELEVLSHTDTLTQLHNRRYYEGVLANQVALFNRHQIPFCLVILDIDFFKSINDRFGHENGDLVLTQVSAQLQTHQREVDTVARIGGEEFALILPNTTLASAIEVANRHRTGIEQMQLSVGAVTASFGVAEIQAGFDCTMLYSQADQALYRAKQNGRNRVMA